MDLLVLLAPGSSGSTGSSGPTGSSDCTSTNFESHSSHGPGLILC